MNTLRATSGVTIPVFCACSEGSFHVYISTTGIRELQTLNICRRFFKQIFIVEGMVFTLTCYIIPLNTAAQAHKKDVMTSPLSSLAP